jgi:hypothetical protein
MWGLPAVLKAQARNTALASGRQLARAGSTAGSQKAGDPEYVGMYDDRSPSIHGGSETNHVELMCKGTTIEARINGVTVASVSDNTFQSGQFWIAVGESPGGAHPDVGAEARFSHLVPTQE